MNTMRFGVAVKMKGISNLLTNPDGASLKRIAWAFGCAKKDSLEEDALRRLLVQRILAMHDERNGK